MYKKRQELPRRIANLILHYGKFKAHWDWFILALTYYTAFAVPLVTAFDMVNGKYVFLRSDLVGKIHTVIKSIYNVI